MAKLLVHNGPRIKASEASIYRPGDILHALPDDVDFGLDELNNPALFLPLIVSGMSWTEAIGYVTSRGETLTTLGEQSHWHCDTTKLRLSGARSPGYRIVSRQAFVAALSVKTDRPHPLWTGPSRLVI